MQFIRSLSNLQLMKACIISWMCSNFCQIEPTTTELAALEIRNSSHIHCRQLLIGHLTYFTLVQKVKIGHKNSCSYKQTKALPRLCELFHSKMTCTFCIDDVRVKVPSFQKVTQFLQYKIFHRDIIRLNVCLFEVIPDCHD